MWFFNWTWHFDPKVLKNYKKKTIWNYENYVNLDELNSSSHQILYYNNFSIQPRKIFRLKKTPKGVNNSGWIIRGGKSSVG